MKTITQKNKKSFYLVALLLVGFLGFSQTVQTFSSNSTFTIPAGVSSIQVEAYGAGGGGGGGGNSNKDGGGGGGGGAYSKNTSVAVIGGATYTISVGNKGIGATSSGAPNGTNGGNTTATFGATTITANGGNGGLGYLSGGAGGIAGVGSTFNGGPGGAGLNGIGSGGGGGGGGTTGPGGIGSVPTGGAAGGGYAGAGGAGTTLASGPGSSSILNYGGGGGGGTKTSPGGNGAKGYMVITYTCPIYSLTATPSSNGPLCNPSVAIVTLRSATMASGNYTVTYNISGATTATASTAIMTFTSGSSGSGTFTTPLLNLGTTNLTVTNLASSYCNNSISTFNTVGILVNSAPTVNSGMGVITCSSAGAVNITAGSVATNYASVTWISNGTGTFNNPNSLSTCMYTPSASDVSSGNVILTLTASNGGCTNATSSKTLIITMLPTVVSGSVINTCANAGAVNITDGSIASNFATITWSSSGSGTFSNQNSLTICTYSPSAADVSAGTITLTLAATGNSPCATVYATKNLVISLPPTAAAGPAILTCYSSGPINISAGAAASNQTLVNWTSTGTGTFSDANSLTNCDYTPSTADITAGSVIITLTAINAGCTNASATKTLNLVSPAVAISGTDINTCSTSSAVNITAGVSASNYSSVTWTSNGTGIFTNPNSLTTCTYTPSAADITTGTIGLTLTAIGNTPCGTVSNSKNLIVSTSPTAVAGQDFATCYIGTAFNITAGAAANNQTAINWSTSGTGTFTDSNSLTACTYSPSAADITAQFVTLTLTSSNAGCLSATATKVLTINIPPTANAGSAIYSCDVQGFINITLGSNATNYSAIVWSSNGTGSFNDINSLTNCLYNPSAADIAAGMVTMTLTAIGNNPCGTINATKNLYIGLQMTANAGADNTTCYTSGAINIGTDATATNQTSVFWTSSGTGTFGNQNSLTTANYTPSAADINAGSVIITLSTSNPGCATATDSQILTILSPATAAAGSLINTCSTAGAVNVTAAAASTNYSSITWTTNGTGTLTNANSLTACTYTPSAADILAGNVLLTLTATGISPCLNVSDTKNLIINLPPTANAGSGIAVCYSSGAINVTDGASATNQISVTWTSNGSGTFSNPNSLTMADYTPSAADIAVGSVMVTLTAFNAGCADAIATKNIIISTFPIVTAGTIINTCSTAGAVNITVGAIATNYAGLVWSSNGTGTFANPNSLTACTYAPSAADIVLGNVVLTLTVTGNTPCGNTSANKNLNINFSSTANAGTPISVCYVSGPINITTGATAANQTTVNWTSNGSGSFANSNSLTTATYTPSATDINTGSVLLTLTASNAGCADAVSTKTITIRTLPTAIAGPSMQTCAISGAINITPGSNATKYTSVNWTSSGTGTFANAGSMSTCTYTPSATDITAGNITLTLTAIGAAPCGNATDTKTLVISKTMTTTAGSAIAVCSTSGASNITAGASATNQTSANWSSNGSGIFANANSLTTCTYTPSAADIAAGFISLTLTVSNAGCSNVSSTKTLNISTLPTAVSGNVISTCATNGAVNITAGSSATNYISVIWTSSGTGTFANANSLNSATYSPSAADISAGNVTLTLTANGIAPCANATHTKSLLISLTPTAVAGISVNACSSNAVIDVTTGSSATNYTAVIWSTNGTGIFTNPNSLTICTYAPSAADIAAGSVLITLTASNNGCVNATSTKTISLTLAPVADAGSDIATCSTCGVVNITANASAANYTSIQWTSSGTGTFTNANSLTACTYSPSAADITTSLTMGGITLTLTATGNSPCTTTTATKVLGITSQTFNSSGTFTVPAGVYQVTVEAWGGGGKGGAGLNVGNVGGGGGGGAYSSLSIAVVPGTTYPVTIGLGATTSSPGGDSWFIDNTTFLSKGGNSAADNVLTGGAGGSTSACIGDLTSRGGNGANGSAGNYGGGGGAGAEAGENMGVDATTYLGAIATCSGGNGGNGYTSTNGDGNRGVIPGGGGGGGRRNGNNGVNQGVGGNGADGKMIIKWPVNALPSIVTTGPGGVTSNLQLWLRSDLLNGTNTVADNTPVTTWYTQARGANAIKPAAVGAPVYRNNAAYNINFNPVVDFTNPYNIPSQVYTDLNASRQYLKGTSGYYTQDTFVVVIPDVAVTSSLNSMEVFSGDRTPCNENVKSGIAFGNVDTRFTDEVLSYTLGNNTSYGSAQVSTTTQYNAAGIINTRNNSGNTGMQLYYNGNNISSSEVNASKHRNVYDSQYWIGRSEGWDGSLDGRIAEIITYSSRKADAIERTKIESYLGIKYGITLGVNGTSQNYLDSSANLIWNATVNFGFNYNIAGIGRDDISKLNQKQSKSVHANSVLTIGLRTIATTNTANTNMFSVDKGYLVWGDNGGNMNDSGTDLVITFGGTSNVTTRTDVANKVWKLVETGGDIATVKVSVATADLAGLPALSGNDAYVMVKATDAAFTAGLETVFLNTNGANQETTYDFDGTTFITFGVAHESIYSRHATFDGADDIMKMEAVNNLSSTFSMMMWVRPTGQNSLLNDRTIVSKFNGTTGYKVYLSANNKVNVSWIGGTTMTSATALPDSQWHNLAVIYSGGSMRLYIDGVLDASTASASPATSTNIMSIGAEYRSKADSRNFFKGDIDEFRLWDKALSLTEVKFIMNQEILQNGTVTKGTIIPVSITKNDINGLNWNNLAAYYSMNSFIGTHINDDSLNNNRGIVFLPNKTTITVQSSPQPYLSGADGLWSDTASWENGNIQQLPYSASIVDNTTRIDWNIVKTAHNVESTGNKVLLGLFVNSNTLSATNDTKLEISHYLRLDGKIDLVDKSQLLQTTNSDLDVLSAGSIEKDQKGQNNIYSYNYWSSPVGGISTTSNNNVFTVNGVLRDGTNPANTQNITWISGYNGSPTAPISLSSYWIFKFQNLTPIYANWTSVGPNGTLQAAQAYTMKGSGAAASQNYTFTGKPNNGVITLPIAPNNSNLCGNPYASAIDANTFINANIASTTGTIYFWEHFTTNDTHNLADYQGGYAARNLVGGTPPVSPAGVSGLGSSARVPGRFIPVSQGFLVYASSSGGTITFDNNQRAFVKEDDISSNFLFRKSANTGPVAIATDNREDATPEADKYARIRLGFNAPNNFHRQLLLGFMEGHATSGIDVGYDASQIDSQPSEMSFLIETSKFVIQGAGYFNVNDVYPLAVKSGAEGDVNFTLDGIENFDSDQAVYIYDNLTNTSHDIRREAYHVTLPVGQANDRFSLRFKNGSELATNQLNTNINTHLDIRFTNSDNTINIANEVSVMTVSAVTLYNMFGQVVETWNVKNNTQDKIQIPVREVSAGTYIVKVQTSTGNISKKIIIK